ncbi:flagellin N-terminal helical domain-containing protein [Sulfitobacter sp. HI0129]|uniref:flagellin N-terminal helical domain-containing protein n=1 Tax=Sulfitobacter sp. HI0129 TaxID=1822268 RepID=UPI0009ED9A1E
MSSILTNTSAMGALSTLRGINEQLGETQNRISTGLKVSSAKDNASYYSISTTMNSESGMNKAVNEGLTLAKNSVSTARWEVGHAAERRSRRASHSSEIRVSSSSA